MRQFRLAVATRCFQKSFAESLGLAVDLGVKGLQVDVRNELRSEGLTETGRRDFMHQISERNLTISGAVFPLRHPLYEIEQIDGRVAAIREAMKFAYSIKATTLCLRAGAIPTDADSKERKLLVEVMCDLARYANHVGTSLAITPTSDSAESLKTLLEEVKTGPIGVDFDPAHYAISGQPVAESLRTLHNLVMHVQLRDGIRGIDGGEEVAVGRGTVDWIEVLALLGEMDYQGWLTSIRTQGQDRLRDLRRGIETVRQILIGS